MFLLDPDHPGETDKPGGGVIRGSGDASPQQGPGAELLVGVRGKAPETGAWGLRP